MAATVLAGGLALALVWALSLTRPWAGLEMKVFDAFSTLAAPGRSAVPIVILAIDEPTFRHVEHAWPFPRSLHARLLDRLQADGAAAVGFDVLFAQPSHPVEDAAFARSIAAASSVVLASAREPLDGAQEDPASWAEVMPLRRFLAAGAVPGESLVQPADDFVVRRANAHVNSFAGKLAALADARAARAHRLAAPSEFVVYRGPRGTFETRSYYEALLPGVLPPGFFRGKIVLIGRSAQAPAELGHAQADLFNAPFAVLGGERLFPGVELQATLIDNQLTGAQLRSVDTGWSPLALMLGLPLLLAAGWRWPASAAPLALLLAGAMASGSWLLFQRGLWWPPLFPVVGVLASVGATALLAYGVARRRARLLRARFAQYVPPAVASRIAAEPGQVRLGGESREITLMFTDLAGFTTLSEQLSPEQTVEVLTACFNAMVPRVHAAGGTVDKFIGDAMMAFWGAPLQDGRHAEQAVRVAIALQHAMPALAVGLVARGLPPVQLSIGLHTGRAVVGNVGSEQRFAYTAVGDAVNVAARLEAANKAFDTGILLSAATAAQLPPDIPLRVLGDITVRGRAEAVRVSTPCADAALCASSAAALQSLDAGLWDDAESHLHAVLARVPGDAAAERLLARLAHVRALGPEAQAGSVPATAFTVDA
ncbi:adenylate/guanylate cyclase domain-containing protein [Acidovorax sp. FG27]